MIRTDKDGKVQRANHEAMLAREDGRYEDALRHLGDEQACRLLAGDVFYGVRYAEYSPRPTRFGLVVRMNDILEDARATYDLFVQFDALLPEPARREAFLALPAVVEAGDFALGERYLPDPMSFLPELNRMASETTPAPCSRAAMSLAAHFSNFAKDVRLRAAIQRGLGRAAEADALLDAALAGLATDDMRDKLREDLASPGAILRWITAQHIAHLDQL